MYTVINRETNFVTVYFETSALARYFDIDRSTIYRRFKNTNPTEIDNFIIYKADKVINKTRKTGFTKTLRQEKRDKERGEWE